MIQSRRGFLRDMLLLGASAAVITTPGLLMRTKSLLLPSGDLIFAPMPTGHVTISFINSQEDAARAMRAHWLWIGGRRGRFDEPSNWWAANDGPVPMPRHIRDGDLRDIPTRPGEQVELLMTRHAHLVLDQVELGRDSKVVMGGDSIIIGHEKQDSGATLTLEEPLRSTLTVRGQIAATLFAFKGPQK